MPNIAVVLKEEISRLARKEVKAQLAATKKAAAQHRREIAALKRQLRDQSKKIASLQRANKMAKPAAHEANGVNVRFSPTWLRAHREKIGLSRADYADLVGVSPMTIFNWEKGKSKPRAQQLAGWAAIRGLGKREAWRQLEDME